MNLQLPLRQKWFGLTKDEIKTEDYREINIYWAKRLIHNLKDVLLKRRTPAFIDDEDCYNFLTNPRNNFGFKSFETNILTLGYPKKNDNERIIIFNHLGIDIREGKEEWGAEPNKLYFVIKHGKQIKNKE